MNVRTAGAWVSVALGGLLALGFLLFRPAAAEAVYPVERAKLSFSRRVWTRVVGVFRGASAQAENVRLRQELAALSLLGGDIERLEAENARLRSALAFASRRPGEWLAASVLSSGGAAAAAHDSLRVDKGTLEGVAVGAAVAVPGGLVGRVMSVSPHTCEVRLLADPSVKVACEIETGDSRPPRGILSGGSDDLLLLRHLVRLKDVPPRSRVVTSGLGGVFPGGIEVGTYLPDGKVLPSVDPSVLEDVFIRREKR